MTDILNPQLKLNNSGVRGLALEGDGYKPQSDRRVYVFILYKDN